jgi:hypothetical protein
MKVHVDKYSIVKMAKILGVTPSGYYGYCNRGPSRRILDDAKLQEDIKSIFFSSRETYGRHRIYLELKRLGKVCSQRRVSRLMKENNLVTKARRKFKVTTKAKSDAIVAPNKLAQNFKSQKPNEKWVSDITYSAPSLWNHKKWPPEHEQGWNVLNAEMEIQHKIPAIGYAIARVETAVTCGVLAG